MRYSPILTTAVLLACGASITPWHDASAQAVPGYRMRMPVGGLLGAPVRPPRLTGAPPSTVDPIGSNRRDRFFFPGYWPFGFYYDGSDGYTYPDSTADHSSETQRVPVQPSGDVYPVYDNLPPVAPLQISTVMVGSTPKVRLSWQDNGVGAKQVAFFLADSAKAVLAAQTIRSAPFTALFDPVARTAYAGMTVMLSGGTLDTQYVPYRRR
jgi:hypothetical protein